MISYKPAKKLRNTVIVIALIFAICLALLLLSAYVSKFKAILSIPAFALMLVAMQMTSRYVLTDYVYKINDIESSSDKIRFAAVKIIGKQKSAVCVFELSSVFNFEKKLENNLGKKGDKIKNHGKVDVRYNLKSNLTSLGVYRIFFEQDNKKIMVEIEISKAFAEEISKRLPYNCGDELITQRKI